MNNTYDDITLRANWTANEYQITYHMGNGTSTQGHTVYKITDIKKDGSLTLENERGKKHGKNNDRCDRSEICRYHLGESSDYHKRACESWRGSF